MLQVMLLSCIIVSSKHQQPILIMYTQITHEEKLIAEASGYINNYLKEYSKDFEPFTTGSYLDFAISCKLVVQDVKKAILAFYELSDLIDYMSFLPVYNGLPLHNSSKWEALEEAMASIESSLIPN